MGSSILGSFGWIKSPKFLQWVLLFLVSTLAFLALIMPYAIRPSSYTVQVGEVATQDIQAPYTLSFTSEILTEQARQDAEKSSIKIYLPADPDIARSQIEKMRILFNYFNTVRADTYASKELRITDITAISETSISPDTAAAILNLNDTRWETVQQEGLKVLEQVMRNTIREDQIGDYKKNIASLVSYSLPQEQASIVVSIVSQFVSANSLFSEILTDEARKQASNSVAPVERKFVAGQMIVQRGQIISQAIIEALEQYGLVQAGRDNQKILASGMLVILVSFIVAIYFDYRKASFLKNFRSLLVIGLSFVIFIYGARLIIPNRTIVPYVFPLSAFSMVVSSLFNIEISIILSLVLSVLSAYGFENSLDLSMFYIITSIVSVLILGKGRRLANFFGAAIAVGAAGSAVIIAYRLTNTITDWLGILTLVAAAFANGLGAASIALLLQYLFSQFLGTTTALQLMEIARPDHPMLQYMLRYAPGSYQHSLQVSNLAEQAAEIIGADALLVRVGAIYHDVGKATNPSFFIENQIPGNLNAHDDLDPVLSSETIIRHVTDGIQLARKFKLPARIQDFIREHHGTFITRYQYIKALEQVNGNAEAVDKELYRYPGPKPQSKETALLMLADGCEARARAEIPKNEFELKTLIKKVFDYCEAEGQLDDTSLTLNDLSLAQESFLNTLKNTYHPRIQYPEIKPSLGSVTLPTQPRSLTEKK